MNLHLISSSDNDFFQEYTQKLKAFQELAGDKLTVYTRITISYALVNDLQIMNLLFHPKSIGFSDNGQIPEYSLKKTKETIEEIIQYELTSSDFKLTTSELEKTIRHFRELEKRK
jgi:hypothetical protein